MWCSDDHALFQLNEMNRLFMLFDACCWIFIFFCATERHVRGPNSLLACQARLWRLRGRWWLWRWLFRWWLRRWHQFSGEIEQFSQNTWKLISCMALLCMSFNVILKNQGDECNYWKSICVHWGRTGMTNKPNHTEQTARIPVWGTLVFLPSFVFVCDLVPCRCVCHPR